MSRAGRSKEEKRTFQTRGRNTRAINMFSEAGQYFLSSRQFVFRKKKKKDFSVMIVLEHRSDDGPAENTLVFSKLGSTW